MVPRKSNRAPKPVELFNPVKEAGRSQLETYKAKTDRLKAAKEKMLRTTNRFGELEVETEEEEIAGSDAFEPEDSREGAFLQFLERQRRKAELREAEVGKAESGKAESGEARRGTTARGHAKPRKGVAADKAGPGKAVPGKAQMRKPGAGKVGVGEQGKARRGKVAGSKPEQGG